MDQPNQIKDAFQRVKEDISILKNEVFSITKELEEIQRTILLLLKLQNNTFKPTDRQTDTSTHP